jgi:SAM-dependent methyltransferase
MSMPFDGLAAGYNQYRPSYPDAIWKPFCDALRDLGVPAMVADVGCGTGISTRALRTQLDPAVELVGVEISSDMRDRAREHTPASQRITYLEGAAEKLPLGTGSAAGIIAAQAAQWFQRDVFYPEACRALQPRGALALVQNNRLYTESQLLSEYEDFLEAESPGYNRDYRDIDYLTEMSGVPELEGAVLQSTRWTRALSIDEFIGMTLSSTKMQAAVKRLGDRAIARVREIAGRHTSNDSIVVPYEAQIFMARRR